MDLTPAAQTEAGVSKAISFEEAKRLRDELLWQHLDKTVIEEAVIQWLKTLSPRTGANYQSGMRQMVKLRLLDPSITLQAFALINHDAVLDQIKLVKDWTECSRQARAACYISFT